MSGMDEFYLMWLSRIEGIGIHRVRHLLNHFHEPAQIWLAPREELLNVKGISPKNVDSILSARKEEQLDNWIGELEEKNIQFISILNPKYPKLLKEIYDPPTGIYLKGTFPDDGIDKVSIVGARRCSQYGANVAYKLSKDLAKGNIVVVSGMARGIDSMAHKGILQGGGQTIAVLGSGVDICYPAENKELMEKIIENGCVISEFPPGFTAAPKNFPLRNRIISGLSKITIVIEAAKRSGTLITADQALENGRDVFVIPGNITSALSEGTNELIKQGCPIITSFEDVLFELGITYNKNEKEKFVEKVSQMLQGEEKAVYDRIGMEPVNAEDIARVLNKAIQDIQYSLSLLELSGHIKKLPQAGYIREL